MHNPQRIAVGIATVVTLSGCATPFGDRIVYDTEIQNAPGTITLSDPKLYTREALISERARDIKWINGLITNSEDSIRVVFKPELVREVEQIAAMAAAIGLKFDPTAAAAYRRDKETDDLQHQIDVMKLQLQLGQLKRDVDLIRASFDSQGAPVNEDISKLGGTSTQSSTTVTASAADQLKAAVDKLNTTLTSRLDADGKLPATTGVTSSPFDDFRDRSAYRDMLKAAQNAAELDQLHDYANARLIRLNFQASVLPDSDNLQSLGAIQIRVVPPIAKSVATQQFLQHWLEYINTNKEYRKDGELNTNDQVIQKLLLNGSFQIIDVFGIDVLLPVVMDGDGLTELPSDIYSRSNWTRDGRVGKQSDYGQALSALSSSETEMAERALVKICTNEPIDESEPIKLGIREAVAREFSNQYIQLADTVARSTGKPSIVTAEIATDLDNARGLLSRALEMMSRLGGCKSHSGRLTAPLTWKALSKASIPGDNGIRVYEIGPREQVQQVSTVARSASSLALAASLASSSPGSGIGAEAAASYSRQAMGRATALERVPSVVGYSQAGDSSFGWVLGPRAVLNAKGHVDMAQLLKTYDLSVDMSVPGWWPTLDLNVATVWAPSPALIASGEQQGVQKLITVPLVRNSVDEFDLLTQYMLGQDSRVAIHDVEGGPINACDKSTLLITGRNIWRAKQVFVLGQAFGEDAISITADMKGILLSVPAIPPLASGKRNSRFLYVITPLGPSEPMEVEYESEPSGDDCKPKKAQPDEASKDAVLVSSVSPSEFVVPSSVELTVTGANLDKVVAVKLGGQQAAELKPTKDKRTLVVGFDATSTGSIRASDNIPIEFFERDKTSDEVSSKASQTRYVRTIPARR